MLPSSAPAIDSSDTAAVISIVVTSHGSVSGDPRGWLYVGSNQFDADEAGVTESQIEAMLVDVPKRYFDTRELGSY